MIVAGWIDSGSKAILWRPKLGHPVLAYFYDNVLHS